MDYGTGAEGGWWYDLEYASRTARLWSAAIKVNVALEYGTYCAIFGSE